MKERSNRYFQIKKIIKFVRKYQCGEFPHFGANYPDACCIDGYLWDLDSCDGEDEDGNNLLTSGGDVPCPYCNTEEYVQGLIDNETPTARIVSHLKFLCERYSTPKPNLLTSQI